MYYGHRGGILRLKCAKANVMTQWFTITVLDRQECGDQEELAGAGTHLQFVCHRTANNITKKTYRYSV